MAPTEGRLPSMNGSGAAAAVPLLVSYHSEPSLNLWAVQMTVAHNTTTREQFWQYSLLLLTSNHCSAVCECFCHRDGQLVTHCLSQVTEVTPAPASKVGDPNMCHNSKAHQCISTNYILLNWRTMPHSAQHVNQDWTWLTPNWSTDSRTVSDMVDWLIDWAWFYVCANTI